MSKTNFENSSCDTLESNGVMKLMVKFTCVCTISLNLEISFLANSHGKKTGKKHTRIQIFTCQQIGEAYYEITVYSTNKLFKS